MAVAAWKEKKKIKILWSEWEKMGAKAADN